jgi:penicillin-binding protein 1A
MNDAEAGQTNEERFSYRVTRQVGEARLILSGLWRKRWFRRATYAAGALLVAFIAFWLIFARDLPDAAALAEYEPALPSVVRDGNGEPVYSFARERRVQLNYDDFPPLLIRAVLSAEDKTFFSHHGVDFTGLAGAVIDYASKIGSGQRAKGGSTITQQVAKNLLLGDEYSPTRKIREMILASRIERAMTKQQILELYLNQIFLGRNAYGVQAASRAYFNKDIGELKLHQFAFLAILPKGPSNYRPETEKGYARALERRNWALGEMKQNGWITDAQYRDAIARPLDTVNQLGTLFDSKKASAGGYYMEEVRRRLMEKFGETDKDGANSVYAGGLWIRTPYDAEIQQHTRDALRNGLLRYSGGHGWSGPIATIEMDDQWRGRFASSFKSIDYQDWRVAVVVSRTSGAAELGLSGGRSGTLPAGYAQIPYRKTGGPAFNALKPGDLIVVKPMGGSTYALRTVPEVSGGMMVEGVRTGRIYAMQGGFDSSLSSYNRVTQAQRQPGSTIKPFVYAAALDNGMTPRDDHRRWAVLRVAIRLARAEMLQELRCGRRWSAHYALGHRTVPQPHDRARRLADRHGSRGAHDQGDEYRLLSALSRLCAGRGRDDGREDGQRLCRARQSWPPSYAARDRLRAGSARHGDLAGEMAPVRWLQRGGLERQAHAPLRPFRAAGDEPDDRLSDRPHHRGRDPARHRDRAGRSWPSAVRQDRHHQRPDQCVVRGWLAGYRCRGLYGL